LFEIQQITNNIIVEAIVNFSNITNFVVKSKSFKIKNVYNFKSSNFSNNIEYYLFIERIIDLINQFENDRIKFAFINYFKNIRIKL